ncbi:MAG: MucR family transcriptional regulator [Myxococcales bacterium]|nr:MucR family transcriptional regulator [Myxococcales bacterium]
MGHEHRPPADICDIVSSFAARPDASVDQIVTLFTRLRAEEQSRPEAPTPAPEEDPEGLVRCQVCGKGFKMLKRHLRTAHGLSEMDYRVRFGLPEDRPLVAPEYSRRKAAQAREAGLGRRAPDLT